MANIIKIGARPKSFKPFSVSVQMPDGSEGLIPVTYKYRTKNEYGQWIDEVDALMKSKAESMKSAAKSDDEEVSFSWERFCEENTEVSADQLLKAVDSWGLDVPLTRESLIQLGNECPAAIIALLSSYGSACREGRLGN